jgi:small-conductance mechanosensitive channel
MLTFVPDWIAALVALVLAAFVAVFAHWAVLTVAHRALARTGEFATALLSKTRAATRAGAVALLLLLLAPALPFPKEVGSWLRDGLLVLFIVSLGWFAVLFVDSAADFYVARLRAHAAEDGVMRRQLTQIRVLRRTLGMLIVVLSAAGALTVFEPVRQFGVSLLASAGVAGLVLGFAARPVLSNLVAGIQLALTHPIGIGDGVVVENEWGSIEEITSSYVVIRLTTGRHLLAPLTQFMEKPFQNLSLPPSGVVVSFDFFAKHGADMEELRRTCMEALSASPLWDRRVGAVEVAAIKETGIEVRVCLSAANVADAWRLCSQARERLYSFLNETRTRPSG